MQKPFRSSTSRYTERIGMRFAIDAHTIGRHLTGNETYVRNLLRQYPRLQENESFLAYVCSEPEAARALPDEIDRRRVSSNPFLRLGYELGLRTRLDQPSLLHVQYTAPLFCAVPTVVSVHDVSYIDRPDFFARWRVMQLRSSVERTVRRAAAILTVSNFSRQRIASVYGIPEEQIEVIYNGVSPAYRPIDRNKAVQTLTRKYGLPHPFLLTVGDLQPRKNHKTLIYAFEEMLEADPSLPHHLVCVGKDTWFSKEIREIASRSRFAKRIHFPGFVPDEDLPYFYNACDLFVFPSFYEGFGIPLVEAMACGRAVACSNCTAMPEVVDSAALLFDPHSISGMARCIRDLLREKELRTRMERLALQNASRFRWEEAARRTLDVYHRVARGARMRMAHETIKA
jgi:glycosyltransferase involved in cell wall biosynthesis